MNKNEILIGTKELLGEMKGIELIIKPDKKEEIYKEIYKFYQKEMEIINLIEKQNELAKAYKENQEKISKILKESTVIRKDIKEKINNEKNNFTNMFEKKNNVDVNSFNEEEVLALKHIFELFFGKPCEEIKKYNDIKKTKL